MNETTKEVCRLPNGYTLYAKESPVGGRTYFSDEIGGGIVIWDTALTDETTLLTAIVEEYRQRIKERHENPPLS